MEAAAMKKYVQDLKESGVDVKKALGSNSAAEKSWKERTTSTGRVYYWNSITEGSIKCFYRFTLASARTLRVLWIFFLKVVMDSIASLK